MLTKKKMWELIKKSNWEKDHDYDRIGKWFLETLPRLDCIQLFEFIEDKCSELQSRFYKVWPAYTIGPWSFSRDSWSDLTAEVVGRGERFFKTITAAKLKKMAKTGDYYENFTYVTQAIDTSELSMALDDYLLGESLHIALRRILKRKEDLPLLIGIHPELDAIISEQLSKGKNSI